MIWKKILGIITSVIPVVGDIKDNIQSENGTKIGSINIKQLGFFILRLIILIYFLKGFISMDELTKLINTF